MPPDSFLPRRDYLRIKAAFRELVDMVGGQTAAGRISRPGQQWIGRYGSTDPEYATCFPPADVIADLEAQCGQPVVSRELAGLAGYDLVREAPETASILQTFGKVAAASNRTIAQIATDLADGRISEDEAAASRALIRQSIDALEQLDASLSRITGEVSVVDISKHRGREAG